ncbi:MAG: protease inhibitor I42 family protein [Deltaproteobacteria bacterium]|nr:protease inhibitor I42 family protein [Deltaproteobacteria bacterium]
MSRSAVVSGITAVVLALSLAACASETAAEPESPTEGTSADELRSLQLTDADNGKTITVDKGRNVLLKLGANPSTGYSWTVASTTRTLGYPISDRFVASPPAADGAVGSGGLQRFVWKTASPLETVGSHTVRLEYKRPWEANIAPAKTYSFTVNIVDPAQPTCPVLSAPSPDFCSRGQIQPRQSPEGCTTGYECLESN